MHAGWTYIIDYGNTAELWQSPGSRGSQAGNPIPRWPDILVGVCCTASAERKARRGKVAGTLRFSRDITSIELKRDRCYRTLSILHPFRTTRSPEIRFRNTSNLTGIFKFPPIVKQTSVSKYAYDFSASSDCSVLIVGTPATFFDARETSV